MERNCNSNKTNNNNNNNINSNTATAQTLKKDPSDEEMLALQQTPQSQQQLVQFTLPDQQVYDLIGFPGIIDAFFHKSIHSIVFSSIIE